MLCVNADAIGELLGIMARAGVDRALAVDALVQALERVATKRQQLVERDTQPRFSAGALLKDLHLARMARESLHVDAPLMECALAEFERVVETGVGNEDYIAVSSSAGRTLRALRSGSACRAAAFERHALARNRETVLQCERLERARWNRIRNVFDRAAGAAAKVRMPRSRRLVGRRVDPRHVQLGDQTEFAQPFKAAIDGRESDARPPLVCFREDIRRRKVAADPARLHDFVNELVVLRQLWLERTRPY